MLTGVSSTSMIIITSGIQNFFKKYKVQQGQDNANFAYTYIYIYILLECQSSVFSKLNHVPNNQSKKRKTGQNTERLIYCGLMKNA